MRRYRYLLLDLDNTLLDFDRAEETAFFVASPEYNGRNPQAETCRIPKQTTAALSRHDIDDLIFNNNHLPYCFAFQLSLNGR